MPDGARMLRPTGGTLECRLNYLHYGSVLEDLSSILANSCLPAELKKYELLRELELTSTWRKRSQLEVLCDVVTWFGGAMTDALTVNTLEWTVEQSRNWRELFHSLCCRGFSFRLSTDVDLRVPQLRDDVNVRIALFVERDLYYPPKVRDGLIKEEARGRFFHLPSGIGWVLGKETYVGNEKYWILLHIESDLVRTSCASVKETFRGWQRVLVRLVIELGKVKGITKLAIATAENIIRSHKPYRRIEEVPASWQIMYNRTAEMFGMTRMKLPTAIDLQVIPYWPMVYASEFFVLDVKSRIENEISIKWGSALGLVDREALRPYRSA